MIVQCPDCYWILEDDVYYQEGELEDIIPLEVVMDDSHASLIRPIPVYPDKEVYPKSRMNGTIWEEKHYCPKCKKEFMILSDESGI